MSEAGKAVFLSYASQDAAAVERIATALRAAGIEVWFDRNELVGGDAWDAKIRGQIAACALFVPVISAATQARREGYFRIEWKLAAQRTHAMADGTPFLLPVVIDGTRDAEALAPAEFRAVQWTRLAIDGERPGAVAVPAFCARVGTLLGAEGSPAGPASGRAPGHRPGPPPAERAARRRVPVAAWVGAIAAVAAIGSYFVLRPKPEAQAEVRPAASASPAPAVGSTAVANDKSLVVLPFENLSPDPENAFFADGMHAEICATLGQIAELKVISRTSALTFKDSKLPLSEIAQKLGVANVVTGSVRREGDSIRIHLELRRANDEVVLWSLPKRDRELKDTLGLQSEIAEQIAGVLQARVAAGSFVLARYTTRNPEAYDHFVRAFAHFRSVDATRATGLSAYLAAIGDAERALALDPDFSAAAALLANAHQLACRNEQDPVARWRHAGESKRWAEAAARMVPGGAGDHGLASHFGQLERDYARGLSYAQNVARALPNESNAYNYIGIFTTFLGRYEESLAAYRQAIRLDPISPVYWRNYLTALVGLRRGDAFRKEHARYQAATRGDDSPAWKFALTGELPVIGESWGPAVRIAWEWRARRFAEVIALADAELKRSETKDLDRLILLRYRCDGMQRLGRKEEAMQSAAALMTLVRKLSGITEVGPAQKDGWHAHALARLGQVDEAANAARRYIDVVRNAAPGVVYEREREVAELHAYLNRPRDCIELLSKLLRGPSRVTVPMLKVDPAWDNVRDDPAFQALLADPKNSAPL